MEVKKNKTLNYLLKILETYPSNFLTSFKQIKKKGFIRGVYVFSDSYIEFKKGEEIYPSLYLELAPNSLIEDLKKSSFITDSFIYNKSVVLVVRVANEWIPAYKNFLLSQYSKMYARKDFKRLNIQENIQGKPSVAYAVLSRNATGKVYMKNKVNKEFATTLDLEDIQGEYDIPIDGAECLEGDFENLKNLINKYKSHG